MTVNRGLTCCNTCHDILLYSVEPRLIMSRAHACFRKLHLHRNCSTQLAEATTEGCRNTCIDLESQDVQSLNMQILNSGSPVEYPCPNQKGCGNVWLLLRASGKTTKPTCGVKVSTAVARSENRRAPVPPIESPSIRTLSYLWVTAWILLRHSSTPSSPPIQDLEFSKSISR